MRSAPLLLVLCACVTVRAPSTERVEVTPARLARGAYLATAVTECVGCHSPRDWSFSLAPVRAGTEGSGGEASDARMKFPGSVVPSNITGDGETGVGNASDGELRRAMQEGIGLDGRVMAWDRYAQMTTEDLGAIYEYLRSLPPLPGPPAK